MLLESLRNAVRPPGSRQQSGRVAQNARARSACGSGRTCMRRRRHQRDGQALSDRLHAISLIISEESRGDGMGVERGWGVGGGGEEESVRTRPRRWPGAARPLAPAARQSAGRSSGARSAPHAPPPPAGAAALKLLRAVRSWRRRVQQAPGAMIMIATANLTLPVRPSAHGIGLTTL